ncbi:hypothetical protein CNMCM8694_005648 [Aspergillus lentulus]|nr:hypothetical protein CNMCM8060_004221 [Aspergillus lentulus]KAF4195906.1 hypothetical protein CNMCM8694_005648 [Aspergillus lentulus]
MQVIKYVVVIATAASALLPPPQSPLNKGCALMPALGPGQEFFQITNDESIIQRRTKERAALDPLSLHTMIEDFSDFQNRFFNGITASNATGVAVEVFDHVGWDQPSIIVSIPGISAKTIVLGAHQDSITRPCYQVPRDYAPGADDNASGVATLVEALRAILRDPVFAQGHAPNTLEFHFYAAEEVGLQGSKQIFDSYSSQGREVKAMLNQDMTGYTGYVGTNKPERIGVLTDYVDSGLTEFVRTMITTYCTLPYVDTACGYACSDHASAYLRGYPAAMAFESKFGDHSRFIHTSLDRADTININHVLQHVRLVIGFAYELGFAALGNEDITEEL